MFPYTVKYYKSEYDIQNNNLLYKIQQQCQNTFGILETFRNFWKRLKTTNNIYFQNIQFIVCILSIVHILYFLYFCMFCVGCESKQFFLKLKLQFLSYKPSQTIGVEVQYGLCGGISRWVSNVGQTVDLLLTLESLSYVFSETLQSYTCKRPRRVRDVHV